VPNARTARPSENSPDRFLVTALTGAGKTTQFLTLPGRKFMYVSDPNCLSSIEGFDVDYEEFVPDITDVDIAIKTLKADVGDPSGRRIDPKTYINWEKHFETHWDKGFFQGYSWIGFDSFTLFSEIIMDRILHLNKRTGKQPEQADWAAQVNTIGNIFRVFASSKVGLYCTGHLDTRQDDLTRKIYNRPYMTGRLRVRIPLLFNNVLVLHADTDTKGVFYTCQTVPEKDFPIVRTSLKGLDPYESVSIPLEVLRSYDNEQATQYGLAAMLRKAGRLGPAAPTQPVPITKPQARRA